MSLADLDVAHVLHPHAVVGAPAAPVIWARGRGATLWDVDGREYVDGTCGLWQCAVGHGRPELARAAAEQMEQLEFSASFWNFSNEPSIRLAARLSELSPDGLDRVFFTNGGSEGIETAIKLVRLAWHAQGHPERNVILSRKAAYHGVGVASLAATGIPPLKEGFGPLAPGFVHLSTGTAIYHIGDEPCEVGPGSIMVIPAGVEHDIEPTGAETVENIDVFVPARDDYLHLLEWLESASKA